MDFKDYYSTLGVAKTATEKEIKQAFRKLARKHHPDVNPGDKAAETQFKEINEAYEVLGDPDKRKKYDELGANWRMYEQAGAPAAGPVAGRRLERQLRAAAARRRLPHDDRRGDARDVRRRATRSPISSTRSSAARGAPTSRGRRTRGGRGAGARAPGRDVEHEIELDARGRVSTARRAGFAIKHDGQARTVDVRIPAGVGDGSRVRVAGEGEHGTGGAQSGDLYLRIRLAPHPQLRAEGTRPLHARAGAADDRGARRRGRGARRSAASRCG